MGLFFSYPKDAAVHDELAAVLKGRDALAAELKALKAKAEEGAAALSDANAEGGAKVGRCSEAEVSVF